MILPYTILALLNAFFLKQLESFFVNAGLSWTLSKIIPYVTLLILGTLIAVWIKKHLYIKLTIARIGLIILGLAGPFVLGFLLNPIYEGDFSQKGSPVSLSEFPAEFTHSDLTVIAIPDCPYCAGSIEQLKVIHRRNPKLRISFVVCSSNPETLARYKEMADQQFEVRLSKDLEFLPKVADYSFPNFVQVKNDAPVYKWSNDQFGVRAIDQLDSAF
jgi:hypothetical protein